MKFTVLMLLSILESFECLAVPVEQGSVSDSSIDVTPYPDMQRRIVDINNMSPDVADILKQNNLSLEKLKEMQAKLQYYTFPASTERASTTTELTSPTAKE